MYEGSGLLILVSKIDATTGGTYYGQTPSKIWVESFSLISVLNLTLVYFWLFKIIISKSLVSIGSFQNLYVNKTQITEDFYSTGHPYYLKIVNISNISSYKSDYCSIC